ncbi:hypothetical protein [Oerskovia paurometabola]|uniref:REase associating with pPIWI RE domain-containing protein n=1 Tax=Oerskovia paurometabola TaxID=162170 RepID=A0ABW1XBK2_9CELL|nr:hypothetical protein [Oerskovia paurometabola]MBM7497787.1 hypothetical protein [Oerskovia paurometabola]
MTDDFQTLTRAQVDDAPVKTVVRLVGTWRSEVGIKIDTANGTSMGRWLTTSGMATDFMIAHAGAVLLVPAAAALSKDVPPTLDTGAANTGLRTALAKLKTAMLGTTDGDLIDPDSEIPAGEMYRLAAEALPSILADALLAAHPAPETKHRVDPEWIKAQRDQGWPDMHPEDYCHRCGARNDINWCASAEDWQTATAAWAAETGREGICCVPCFIQMHREATGRDVTWVPTPWRGSWDLHAAHPAPAPVSATRREAERLGAKYRVERTSDPTGKHEECGYFVLDPRHDPHAVTAIRAYSAAVRSERPGLADDLDAWVGVPVSDARREDDELVETVARALSDDWNPDRDPVLTAMFRDYAQTAVTTVLAVFPAPPVVDEAEIDAVVALAAREMLTPGSTFLLPHERAMVHHVGRAVAAHLRGASR